MKRQFTATVYVKQDNKILLVHHKKLHKWLPPGGHVHENELPTETAVRETKEETGLTIVLDSEDHIEINEPNAISLARPYLCLLEEIPAYDDEPAHQHIDLIYLGRVVGGRLNHNPDEHHNAKWFSLEDLKTLTPEHHIFKETLDTIRKVLK